MNFSCSKYRGRNAELIRLINPVDYSLFTEGELVKLTQKWEETLLKLRAQCMGVWEQKQAGVGDGHFGVRFQHCRKTQA